MKPAIFQSKSQNVVVIPEPAGTVSSGLESDRSKMPLWAAIEADYGDNPPLLVGFDTEYTRRGDQNHVLSYQFAALAVATGAEWCGIAYSCGRRYGIATFLSEAVRLGLEQGRIKSWPTEIYLLSHFSLADLVVLGDFQDQKARFDAVRRTFVTIGQASVVKLWDAGRHEHPAKIVLRDTMLLAPGKKQSLHDLGQLVGLKKIELGAGEIEHMDDLLAGDEPRFREYALRDPEICIRYAMKMLALNFEVSGEPAIPPTLSSVGVSFLLRLWRELGIDRQALLGTETVVEERWNASRLRLVEIKREVPCPERYLYESFATECFHGGRSEQYMFGAGTEGVWNDFDLAGAYTTAMCLIGKPNWNGIRQTRDVDEFQPGTLGFARVRFRFPDGTRFPSLPVRTASGLVFPLSGESFCCSPEVYLAGKMGAQLEIVNGIVVPTDFNVRAFEQFVVECSRRRKLFAKGSLEELLWKELGNATYGKTAQGLSQKRCFDSRAGEYRSLPPSKITNPYFAAFTTSFVRAALGEILWRLPEHVQVCSATTDGLLANATEAEAKMATEGAVCQLFSQTRLRISGDPTVLEVKHRIAQPLGWRTRGQATLKEIEGEQLVLAKAGLKPPMRDSSLHNAWIVDQFVNRTPQSKNSLTVLRSLPDIWRNGGDLVPKEIVRRLSMEYDWKRRPVNPATRPIAGIPHLFFDTVPWRSADEFSRCRQKWKEYQGRDGAVLKTVGDLAQFEGFKQMPKASRTVKRPHRGGPVVLAQRMFLRAYVRSAWGLNAKAMSYSELAAWLTAAGYPTRKSDVENAARRSAKLVPHLIPRCSEVEALTSAIQGRFPSFEEEMVISRPPSY